MDHLSRRAFLQAMARLGLSGVGLGLLAGCGGLASGRGGLRGSVGTEWPETTSLRFVRSPSLCFAPQYVAEDLLRAEGFTDVQFVETGTGVEGVTSGQAHLSMGLGAGFVARLDQGDAIVLLGGVHVGCYELFGADQVRAIRDLKGQTVNATELGSGRHMFLASMLTHVGLDPRTDVTWVTHPAPEAMQLLAEGKIDAFLAFPPEP